MRESDWKYLVAEALRKAFNVEELDEVEEQQMVIRGTLTYFEDEEALWAMTRRGLLERDSFYYFDVKANVSMTTMTTMNVTDLCQPPFAEAFGEGMAENKDYIQSLQIYAVSLCNGSLFADTWQFEEHGEDKEKEERKEDLESEELIMDILPILVLLGVLMLTVLIGMSVQRMRGIDSLKYKELLLFSVSVCNVFADMLFAVKWWMVMMVGNDGDAFSLCMGGMAVLVVLGPMMKNLLDLRENAMKWRLDNVHGAAMTEWLNEHGKGMYLLSFLCCTTYGALELVNCRLCGLAMFSMGLPPPLQQRWRRQRLWVVLLADLPQTVGVFRVFVGSLCLLG